MQPPKHVGSRDDGGVSTRSFISKVATPGLPVTLLPETSLVLMDSFFIVSEGGPAYFAEGLS